MVRGCCLLVALPGLECGLHPNHPQLFAGTSENLKPVCCTRLVVSVRQSIRQTEQSFSDQTCRLAHRFSLILSSLLILLPSPRFCPLLSGLDPQCMQGKEKTMERRPCVFFVSRRTIGNPASWSHAACPGSGNNTVRVYPRQGDGCIVGGDGLLPTLRAMTLVANLPRTARAAKKPSARDSCLSSSRLVRPFQCIF